MNKLVLYIILFFVFLPFIGLAQKGAINGRVYNVYDNEAIPYANILIKESKMGTTSDIDGNFSIEDAPPGFIRLVVSSLGYEKVITGEIQIINAGTVTHDIGLTASPTKLDEVDVKAAKFIRIEDSPLSMRSIGIAEIETNPGTNRDISRVIQSFPGVASTPVNRNDIIVRGGGPSESRYYLDDVEIPNINHFATQGASGGSNGILNADFIREVNFYSGGFPASKGNALSAIFEFRQKDGNSDKLKYRGTVGASELSVTADGPIGNKSTIIVSVRRSYLQLLFKLLKLPFLPTFNDLQLKSRTKIDWFSI